ncbi:MAG: helix-turn-helix transcriptional regulator [Opitutales bacterium]|nr:helix-turn-helix transcriptional regulator [Opitutales bacterium]
MPLPLDETVQHFHLGSYPRKFCAPPFVSQISFSQRPRSFEYGAFPALQVCILLQGSGIYRCNEVQLPAEAPSCFIFPPGANVYFAAREASPWEEIIITYPEKSNLEDLGIHTAGKQPLIWALHSEICIRQCLNYLQELLYRPFLLGHADRIDKLCGGLIMELKLAGDGSKTTVLPALLNIRDYIHTHFLEAVDIAQLAKSENLSMNVLRRRWTEWMGDSPNRYLLSLRMQEACRLLVTTGLPIKDIAGHIRIDDALYFSRKLHQFAGMSATTYRKLYGYTQPKEKED